MLYAGLDLSRQRLDVHLLREDGSTALAVAVAPDADALRALARRIAGEGEPVRATVEGMTGARGAVRPRRGARRGVGQPRCWMGRIER